jgi:hypothetical protein
MQYPSCTAKLWAAKNFHASASASDFLKMPVTTLNSLINVACYAA